jgi:hypothetical protein
MVLRETLFDMTRPVTSASSQPAATADPHRHRSSRRSELMPTPFCDLDMLPNAFT